MTRYLSQDRWHYLWWLSIPLCEILVVPLLTKRAMHKVLRILKRTGTTDPEGAKSIVDLGLNPPSLGERIMRTRDYKPKALEFLINLNIVLYNEEGKIYLSEEKLLSSALIKRWPSLAKDIRPE